MAAACARRTWQLAYARHPGLPDEAATSAFRCGLPTSWRTERPGVPQPWLRYLRTAPGHWRVVTTTKHRRVAGRSTGSGRPAHTVGYVGVGRTTGRQCVDVAQQFRRGSAGRDPTPAGCCGQAAAAARPGGLGVQRRDLPGGIPPPPIARATLDITRSAGDRSSTTGRPQGGRDRSAWSATPDGRACCIPQVVDKVLSRKTSVQQARTFLATGSLRQ